MVSGLISLSSHWIDEKRRAVSVAANDKCMDDIKARIARLDDYMNAKKAAQASGTMDAAANASLNEKLQAMQSFKARCGGAN